VEPTFSIDHEFIPPNPATVRITSLVVYTFHKALRELEALQGRRLEDSALLHRLGALWKS
jgi:hypothetical protein